MAQYHHREELGITSGHRGLIICCEMLGFSHATTAATYSALRTGIARSARVIVPGAWIHHAISKYRGEDVGISLVLNSDHPIFNLAPLTLSPTLLNGAGSFPNSLEELWDHADLDEVRRELRLQIERLILWGVNLSHLSSHREALVERPEFFDVLMDLAHEFKLPVRLSREMNEETLGFPAYALAEAEGIVMPDHIVEFGALGITTADGPMEIAEKLVETLDDGITELTIRVGTDTPEFRALESEWPLLSTVTSFALAKEEVLPVFHKADVGLFSYQQLKSLVK